MKLPFITRTTILCLAFLALRLPSLWANMVFVTALLTGLLIPLWLEKKESR